MPTNLAAKSTGSGTIRILPSAATKAREAAQLLLTHSKAFDRAQTFMKAILFEEVQLAKQDPTGTAGSLIHELGSANLVVWFREQFDKYKQRVYPFDAPCRNQDVLGWWKALKNHPQANALAMITIKIHSALINSMADERTGSRITWLNSPLRSSQGVDTLVNMVQVRQWYKHHDSSQSHATTIKSRACRPVVGFYDTSSFLASAYDSDDSESNYSDAGEESNNAEAAIGGQQNDSDDNEEGSPYNQSLAMDRVTSFSVDEDINLDVPAWCKVVAEGSEGLRELHTGSAAAAKSNKEAVGSDKEDWDW